MKTLFLFCNLFFLINQLIAQFGPPILIDNSILKPHFVTTTDIDFDQDLDIIVADRSDEGYFLFRNIDGQGVFEPGISIGEAFGASIILPADFDNDGDQDFVATSEINGTVRVIWNNDGLGNNFSTSDVIFHGGTVEDLKAIPVDVDNDCFIDILTDRGSWYKNNGSGDFSEENIFAIRKLDDYYINDFNTADLDGDGDEDFIVSRWALFIDTATISWIENVDGVAQYEEEKPIGKRFSSQSVFSYSFIHPSDIDNDGDMDILVTDGLNDEVSLFINSNNTGAFNEKIMISQDVESPRTIKTYDIDGDEDLDIIVGLPVESIVWYENQGNNIFSTENYVNNGIIGTRSLCLADLNNDNAVDIISAGYSGSFGEESQIVWNENLFNITPPEINTDSTSLLLYPNPTNGPTYLNIKSNFLGVWQIQITNSSGQLVKELEITIPANMEVEVCLGTFPPGTYQVFANADGFSFANTLFVF